MDLRTVSEPSAHADPVVELDRVSVRYRLPRERILSFKEYAIHWLRRRIRYEEFRALNDLSLTVERGETIGVVGPNGAGKSTLLKVVAGVLRPTSGRVRVWGRVTPLLELGAGFELELTGRENALLNGTLLGYSRNDVEARFSRIAEFAGLGEFIDAPLRTYSAGMIARLAFAVTTDVQPDVLLIDEILSVGDTEFQRKASERFEAFRRAGSTVLLVSHDLATVARMCDRVVWLDHGRVRLTGPAARVLDAYTGQSGPTPLASGA